MSTRTVRIWDYTQDACINVLSGHTAPVRGLMWNTEVPYLLTSGSWDYTIRVWDTRDGTCLDTVYDHGADVYGRVLNMLQIWFYALWMNLTHRILTVLKNRVELLWCNLPKISTMKNTKNSCKNIKYIYCSFLVLKCWCIAFANLFICFKTLYAHSSP